MRWGWWFAKKPHSTLSTITTSHQPLRNKNKVKQKNQQHDKDSRSENMNNSRKGCEVGVHLYPGWKAFIVNNLLCQQGTFYSFDLTRDHVLEIISVEYRIVLLCFYWSKKQVISNFLELRGQSRWAVFSESHWRSSALKDSLWAFISGEPSIPTESPVSSSSRWPSGGASLQSLTPPTWRFQQQLLIPPHFPEILALSWFYSINSIKCALSILSLPSFTILPMYTLVKSQFIEQLNASLRNIFVLLHCHSHHLGSCSQPWLLLTPKQLP